MKPLELDPVYFRPRSWGRRVQDWLRQVNGGRQAAPFLLGNLEVIRQILAHPEIGLHMTVNIGADALVSFLRSGDYKNIYENPVVGGKRRAPSKERKEVDALLGFGAEASKYYFGAVSLGGTGVRFYGEYCMVIRNSRVTGLTRIFDRDSYDLLQPPLSGRGVAKMKRIVKALSGTWGKDVIDMIVMKTLPRLPAAQHLITVGSVSSLVMTDQEFVEVQLKDKIHRADLEEIRMSPDESAIEASILNRKRSGQPLTLVEVRWVRQRRQVLSQVARDSIPLRIVTAPGKGYQWT